MCTSYGSFSYHLNIVLASALAQWGHDDVSSANNGQYLYNMGVRTN